MLKKKRDTHLLTQYLSDNLSFSFVVVAVCCDSRLLCQYISTYMCVVHICAVCIYYYYYYLPSLSVIHSVDHHHTHTPCVLVIFLFDALYYMLNWLHKIFCICILNCVWVSVANAYFSFLFFFSFRFFPFFPHVCVCVCVSMFLFISFSVVSFKSWTLIVSLIVGILVYF